MYQSPIEKFYGDIQSQIEQKIEQDENQLMMQLRQEIGYAVDKEELIKALQYDRQQYEKGYQDGLKHLSEDTVTDWMVEYIQINGIKHLMELVMKAIEKENENGTERHD